MAEQIFLTMIDQTFPPCQTGNAILAYYETFSTVLIETRMIRQLLCSNVKEQNSSRYNTRRNNRSQVNHN